MDTGRSEFSELIESDCHKVTNYNLFRSHKKNDAHYIRITKQREKCADPIKNYRGSIMKIARTYRSVQLVKARN